MSTSLNNKKYLDLVGLQKLADDRRLNPTTTAKTAGAYKVGMDDRGHVVIGDALTAADFGVSTAMHFAGISTTDPKSTAGATITGVTSFTVGDVCLYKRSGETSYEEYIYVQTGTDTYAWEILGDADSYALKTISISAGGDYLTGGGTLAANRTISHKTYDAVSSSAVKVGRDSGGHVVFGGALEIAEDGAHTHSVTASVPASTYVDTVTPTTTKLSVSTGTKSVVTSVPTEASSLDVISITPTNGTATVSKVTAGTAKDVATIGTNVTVATAATDTTTIGNANVAAAATRYGTANVGDAVTHALATTGTAKTVATAGAEITYGTANVGKEVTYGNANRATSPTTVATGVKSVSTPEITVKTTSDKQAYTASVDTSTETLTLTPITISATATAPIVTLNTDGIYEAVTSSTKLTPAVASTTKLTPVGGTVSITPAVDKSITIYPAVEAPAEQTIYGAVESTSSIRGVGGTTTITPAKANGTITPYTVENVTVAKAGTAVNVAAGTVSAAGTGATVLTGLGTLGTASVLSSASLVTGDTGTTVVTGVSATKNTAAKTISGTAATNGAHAHEFEA